jgi:hypothetical protein
MAYAVAMKFSFYNCLHFIRMKSKNISSQSTLVLTKIQEQVVGCETWGPDGESAKVPKITSRNSYLAQRIVMKRKKTALIFFYNTKKQRQRFLNTPIKKF